MDSAATEPDKVRERYQRRTAKGGAAAMGGYLVYMVAEREKVYREIVEQYFPDPKQLEILEVGAGGGGNINFFRSLGIPAKHIHANELLEDRLLTLKSAHPDIQIHPGNALDLSFKDTFDIVFQSTVFTSILDVTFKNALAKKMLHMLKPGGIILWYDFAFNNPSNPDVKGVTTSEVEQMFGKPELVRKVTLAPPIAKRIGSLYSVVNTLFPFLRTHRIVVIKKAYAG